MITIELDIFSKVEVFYTEEVADKEMLKRVLEYLKHTLVLSVSFSIIELKYFSTP